MEATIATQTPLYKTLEMVLLFVGVPLVLVSPLPIPARLGIGLVAVIYAVIVMYRMGLFRRADLFKIDFKTGAKDVLLRFILLAVVTTAMMFYLDPENLFIVPRKSLALWVFILFVYTILSVFPQELLYRTFFMNRYSDILINKWVMILVNAALFSFCHIIFNHYLVYIFTFLGGILFAMTYRKTRSFVFVSFEHALYGLWLFTVGMGEMLAFPMPG